jgi:hypothetical protein
MGWLSLVADVSSLLSLLVTLVTLWLVRRIERSYLAQARLPEVIKNLVAHGGVLNQLVGAAATDPNARHLFRGEVASYRETLVAAKRVVTSGDAKKTIVRELKGVEAWLKKKTNTTPNENWAVYNGSLSIRTALGHLERDARWRAGR